MKDSQARWFEPIQAHRSTLVDVFTRQADALYCEHDVLVGLTTSGASRNVVRALGYIHGLHQCDVTVLTGANGYGLAMAPGVKAIVIPSADTARIQEMHLMLGHMLIAALEKELELV